MTRRYRPIDRPAVAYGSSLAVRSAPKVAHCRGPGRTHRARKPARAKLTRSKRSCPARGPWPGDRPRWDLVTGPVRLRAGGHPGEGAGDHGRLPRRSRRPGRRAPGHASSPEAGDITPAGRLHRRGGFRKGPCVRSTAPPAGRFRPDLGHEERQLGLALAAQDVEVDVDPRHPSELSGRFARVAHGDDALTTRPLNL